MMPKPLDLKMIKEEISFITSEIEEEYDYDCCGDKSSFFDLINDRLYNFFKGKVKSACEFYLKYKDNPKLLLGKIELSDEDKIVVENVIKALDELDNAFWATPARYGFVHYMVLRSYNEWLFKLAFKDVLDEEVG